MTVDFAQPLADLDDETSSLQDLLGGLSPEHWNLPTTAHGWAVRDQVSHLAYFDDVACLAVTDARAFERTAARLRAKGSHFPDVIAERSAGGLLRICTGGSRHRVPSY